MDPPRPIACLLAPAPHYIPHRFVGINYRNDYLYGVCYGISYTFLDSAFCSTSPAGFSCSFCIFFPRRAGLIVPLLLASVGFSPLGFLSLVLAISLTSTALIFLIIEVSPANTLAFSSSILSNCLLCLA
jgi:hypothetical protein